MGSKVIEIYKKLLSSLGSQGWWPADLEYHRRNNSDYRFEIIVGAILTQNTAWNNVIPAIENLKRENLLTVQGIRDVNLEYLEELIRSTGYYHQKALRLKTFVSYLLDKYNGSLDELFSRDLYELREELLEVKGVGPETADSVLLYAGDKPVFVVDTYTKRLCQRFPLPVEKLVYDEIQCFFQNNLECFFRGEELIEVYKEYHALIVYLGKTWCKRKPLCSSCPIREDCSYSKPVS